MKKPASQQLLWISHGQKNKYLSQVITALSNSNWQISVITDDKNLADSLKNTTIQVRRRDSLNRLHGFESFLRFTFFLPLLTLIALVRLIIFRIKGHQRLLLDTLSEKILYTPWARLLGYQVYWFEGDYLPAHFTANIYSLSYRLWAKLAIVVANSHALKEELVKVYKLSENKINVINVIIDKHEEQASTGPAQNGIEVKNNSLFVIGFSGDLEPSQGIEYLLKSIEHFQDVIPTFQIIIVGDGGEKKNLLWLSKMIGLGQKVRFVGRQAEVKKWYSYFDILVLPRIEKINFSQTAAEAMAAGLPIVGSDLPGIREIVNHQAGILVPPKDTQALANAIITLFHDKQLRAQFAKQAQARMQFRYSQEAVVEEWIKLLK